MTYKEKHENVEKIIEHIQSGYAFAAFTVLVLGGLAFALTKTLIAETIGMVWCWVSYSDLAGNVGYVGCMEAYYEHKLDDSEED